MKFTGRLKEPVIDYLTGRLTILFETYEDFREAYEELKDKGILSLEIKPYKKKRSLDANAYYWVLLTKLARLLELSNPEAHNRMICHYGYPVIIGGGLARTPLPDTEEVDRKIKNATEYHLKSTSDVKAGKDGVTYRTYIMMRGSSEYNTEEMARLIKGLISECKDYGIPDSEIATPDEKRLLKKVYGVDIG
ncbi:hypothetical protein [Faecalicatena contorta]|uniref:Uncharacterized protein n=1 Tax=Faecalicatena contorta TaxID=39482 RepID=A0A315ZVU8_9FIRM|nr:hypothetical protein [Faecalicatena contorta]PWJ49322.1 hypothetical protein A8805_10718 [Faecalicatena contorta]SUQ14566.1 hypothetical protein SAMN05216529_10718 [Faecalicatena contorta]